jgi:putative phage-type endonuclease
MKVYPSFISVDDIPEIIEDMFICIEDYLRDENIRQSSPTFHKDLIQDITTLFYDYWVDCNICNDADEDYDEIENIVEEVVELYYQIDEIPKRAIKLCDDEYNHFKNASKDMPQLSKQIMYLKEIPQSKQKTSEWYQTRHSIISASNLWKVFGSDAQRNSLIYEKCKPINPALGDTMSCNPESTLHWGVKYEPVSVLLYEYMFNTKIDDFGCIIHPKHPFIGASPDGINVDPNNTERYGRMLEIKNICNREITGIPKEDYWIQTQIQMETCDLDECDFLETRFLEYKSETEFYENTEHEYKGVILYFIHRIGNSSSSQPHNNSPVYRYMPLVIAYDKETIEYWIQSTKESMREEFILFSTLYWYLDEYSCVFIPRNRSWFATALPLISDLWDIIVIERSDGYEHRMSKKRQKPEVITDTSGNNSSDTHYIRNMPKSNRICLIKLESST